MVCIHGWVSYSLLFLFFPFCLYVEHEHMYDTCITEYNTGQLCGARVSRLGKQFIHLWAVSSARLIINSLLSPSFFNFPILKTWAQGKIQNKLLCQFSGNETHLNVAGRWPSPYRNSKPSTTISRFKCNPTQRLHWFQVPSSGFSQYLHWNNYS